MVNPSDPDNNRDGFLGHIEDVRLEIASAYHFGTDKEPTRAQLESDLKSMTKFRDAMRQSIDAFENLSPRDQLNLRPNRERDDEFNHYPAFQPGRYLDLDKAYIETTVICDAATDRIEFFQHCLGNLSRGQKNLIPRKAVRRLASMWTYLGGSVSKTVTFNKDTGGNGELWPFRDFCNAVGRTVSPDFSADQACKEAQNRHRKAAKLDLDQYDSEA